MNLNEATAACRRIPILMRDATTKAYTASLTFSGAEMQISKNGAAWGNGAGSVAEYGGSGTGAGAYYYEATSGEVDTRGKFEIKITKSGMDPWIYEVPIKSATEGDIDLNEATAAARRMPIVMQTSTGSYTSGLTFSGSEVQLSKNGGAWADGLGTVAATGNGVYYYPADTTEVDTRGILSLKVVKSGITWFYTASVYPAVDTTAPVIAAVSPTPGTAPGAAGGFSSNFAIASVTPIVIDISDASTGLALAYVTARSGTLRETAYRATSFAGDFVVASYKTTISGGNRLALLPVGGWPANADTSQPSFITLDIDAIDAAGNVTSTSLVWNLPAKNTEIVFVPAAVAGQIDHVREALGRLPQQFKDLAGPDFS